MSSKGIPSARERGDARDVIAGLSVGDVVRVTGDGVTDAEMTVTRGPHRSDGAFGHPDSVGVTVSFGPGRFATRVSADGIASGAVRVELVRRAGGDA